MAGEYEFSPILNNLTWSNLVGISFFKTITTTKFNIEKTPKQLFNLAEKGCNKSINIWQIYGNNLGLCLSHIISIIDPNYISIGGGISKANRYFNNNLIKTLEDKCLTFNTNLINISYDNNISNIFYGWLD